MKHFRVPASLGAKLEEHGVNVTKVLRQAGLPRDFFAQSRILVTTEQLFALWRAIGDVSTDPEISLKLSMENRIEHFSPMGITALSTASFGAAMDHMARYKRLTAPEEITQKEANGEWIIRYRWVLADATEPPVLIEHCFAWMANLARVGSGTRICPLRVELMQIHSNRKTLERYFGCLVKVNASRNAIVYRIEDKAIPFITRNVELHDMLAPQFEQELRESANENSFIEMARGAILDRLTGSRPTVEDIARMLHLSSRTLQRRLREAGSSFQKELDEARRQMAHYYLSNSVLEVSEAAYLLGYEDANSFARAFRTWEGVPPGIWRENARAEPHGEPN